MSETSYKLIREALETGDDTLHTILKEAATQAVKDRVGAAYRGIYKTKIVPWSEPRPYTEDELQESMLVMFNPEDTLRGFSDRDSVEGRAPTSSWSDMGNTGLDTRDVISDDNMVIVLEQSEILMKAITIEAYLKDLDVAPDTTTAEELAGWNNWRRDRIAQGKAEDAVLNKARADKRAETRASLAATLAKLS